MSKSYGMAGWRVGYAVYPAWASDSMVKIQDTLPTHASTASQKLALAALETRGDEIPAFRITPPLPEPPTGYAM